jgi:multiple sugar transport system ATP-binding protein
VVTAGEAVHLEVDPEGWRLFDAAGDALLPPPAAPAPPREPQLPRLG